MMVDDRLAIAVSSPSAGTFRWGADEAAVGDIPKGLQFTTSDPGGFKDANLSLSRRINVQWPDLGLFNDVAIYGAGRRTAWEGRLQETPAHHGDDYQISPGAVGHVAALDDDPSFREIYIDSDLSGWGEPSTQRQIDNITAQNLYQGQISTGFQDSGSAGPAVITSFTRLVTNAARPYALSESFYYGGGVPLGKLRYDGQNGGGIGSGDANWDMYAILTDDDRDSIAHDLSSDHNGTSAANQTVTATTATRLYAVFYVLYRGTATADGEFTWRWVTPKVIGRHGLTEQGVWPNIGVLASDMIADIVSRTAPGLNFTTGNDGSIVTSTYPIPHMVFIDVTKGSDAILAVNAYHQYSWGVEDNKTFFWRPTSTYRKRWRVRRSRGDQIDLLGPQAENAVNGIVATFTDPAGQTRVVGPPDCPGAFATSDALQDTSATNPVNAAGIGRKWAELQLNFVTDANGAIQVAYAKLQELLTSNNARGSVVVTATAEDESGVLYPAWCIRAGDSVTVTDGDNVERRVIETTYDHDSRQLTANLDSTPHKVEALMERMGVVLTGIV